MRPRRCRSKEGLTSRGESSTAESRKKLGEEARKTSPYPLRSRAEANKRQDEPGRTCPYSLRSRAGARKDKSLSSQKRSRIKEETRRRDSNE
ncbi:hypothetical protein TNCT_459331 [Trichonephila clavata]|uniref:Uncharacterized protein n=1 Tax=Trichonephila clavata TaxID=2740835 RepID=A0A8X6GPZ1_TRICU|nr:hypothetical protein TNCT_459331 [Trichonephila clavata]